MFCWYSHFFFFYYESHTQMSNPLHIVTYFGGLGVLLGCYIVLSFCRFGSTQRQIWLDNVRCSGNESRLVSCSRSSYVSHNCDHSKDVAIYCYTSGSNTGTGIPGTISSS